MYTKDLLYAIYRGISTTFLLVFVISLSYATSADEALVCNEFVQISIGSECENDLTADVLLENPVVGCDYSIFIEGALHDNILDASTVGKYFTVTVQESDACGGNKCWSTIFVEDKLAPVLPDTCSREMPCEFKCATFDEEDFLDSLFLFIQDSIQECRLDRIEGPIIKNIPAEDCLAPDTIEYIYTAIDEGGLASSKSYFVTLSKIDITTVTMPDDFSGSCEDDRDPSVTGYPLADGDTIKVDSDNESVCNLMISYMDKDIPTCDRQCANSNKIVRNWIIVDWCSQTVLDSNQVISLKDTMPPVIDTIYPPDPYSVDPWNCEVVEVTLPTPETRDVCNPDNLTFTVIGPAGVEIDGLKAYGLFKGENEFIYYAEDCCGNISEPDTVTITVIDEVKPVAIAKEFTVISLVPENPDEFDETAIAKLFATSIDNGSYDKCGNVKIEIRREIDSGCRFDGNESYKIEGDENLSPPKVTKGDFDEDGGEYVKFCCRDATAKVVDVDGDGNNEVGVHIVWIRVWDDANMDGEYGTDVNGDGIYGNDGDNYNETWAYVKVEDPTPPEIIVEDLELFCHDPYDFEDNNRSLQRLASNRDLVYVVSGCENNGRVNNVEGPFFMKGGKVSLHPDGNAGEDPHPSIFGFNEDRWAPFDYTCDYGYGWLRYTAETFKGGVDVAYQLIKVIYKDDFACEDVQWPDSHIETDCANIPMDNIDFTAGPCELIGWTVNSDTFSFQTESCMKIVNEYTVIDWCVNEIYKSDDQLEKSNFYALWNNGLTSIGGSGTHSSGSYFNCTEDTDSEVNHISGVYKFFQTIKIVDTIPPVIANTDDWYFPVINEDCNVEITVSNTATDLSDCQPTAFRWELQLDYNNDGKIDDAFRQDGIEVSYTLDDLIDGPMNRISAKWKVWDGCGNVNLVPFNIYVVDDKAPTPYCIDLSSALMEDPDPDDGVDEGMVELWAADFDLGSYDYCYDVLYFTFDNIPFGNAGVDDNGDALAGSTKYIDVMHYYSADTDNDGRSEFLGTYDKPATGVEEAYLSGDDYNGVEVFLWIPAGKGTPVLGSPSEKYTAGRVYTCEDYSGTEVIMTVWDGKFNYDFCTVDLTLEGVNNCGQGTTAMIAGNIKTEAGEEVGEVEVTLGNLSNSEIIKAMTTLNDGYYAFSNNPMHNDYEIAGEKNGNDSEGVSTLDIVIVQRHLLGISLLDSPYKLIAADVNNDRKVKSSDLIIMRKLILGLYDEYPESSSWRFIDAGQSLSIENALETYNDFINIDELAVERSNENFVAVKIGDVNGDAKVNARNIRTVVRNDESLPIRFENREVKKGQTVTVDFSSDVFQGVYGFQMSLDLQGLTYQDAISGEASIDNSNIASLDEVVNISFSDISPLENGHLFSLRFTVERDGQLADMLNMNQGRLNSEAYVGNDLAIHGLELTLAGDEIANNLLGQNEPNPFNESTVIGFTLAKEGSASLTVHNGAGKIVKQITGTYSKGYHEVQINKEDLHTSGVLYYTLRSGEFTSIKKMIIIE